MEELDDGVLVEVLLQVFFDVAGQFGISCFFDEVGQHSPEAHELVDGRRDDEVEKAGNGRHEEQEGGHDADDAVAQPQFVLEKFDRGINHVGQEPSDEERQEHGAEQVDDVDGQSDARHDHQATDEFVKGDFVFKHDGVKVEFDVFVCLPQGLFGSRSGRAVHKRFVRPTGRVCLRPQCGGTRRRAHRNGHRWHALWSLRRPRRTRRASARRGCL